MIKEIKKAAYWVTVYVTMFAVGGMVGYGASRLWDDLFEV